MPDRDGVPLPLLVFDGDCGFCTSTARAAQRWLGLAHVLPWQHLDLDSVDLSAAECQRAVQWIGADGAIAAGDRAVAAALRHAGGGWRAVGTLISLPVLRWLAAGAYRMVARLRYRLPGGTPACRIGPP